MNSPHALVRWSAGAIAEWEREAPVSVDDPAARIVLLGPRTPAGDACEIIPSWGADTPPGSWIELQLRAETAGAWGRWFRVARWDNVGADSQRTSFDKQKGDDGRLATDTLVLAAPAVAVQARVLLCAAPGADMPELESLALCFSRSPEERAPAQSIRDEPWQQSPIEMPLLVSQYLNDPVDGHRWCSPTALTMLLAYWHQQTGNVALAPFGSAAAVLERAVPLVYDPGWDGTGNWIFNTAFAATLGLTAYVTRLHSLDQLARWTAAGVPVIISISWKPGQLEGAGGSSSGHLTIVTGVAGERVLMVEPAAREVATLVRSYRADQLFERWQHASDGAVYIVHPPDWPRPEPGEGDAWA